METINSAIMQFRNMPRAKKIILVLIFVILIVFVGELIMSYSKQHYKNPTPKKSSNIEKLNTNVDVSANDESSSLISVGNVTLDTEKVNVTLYFADWCGHCKQFIASTWNKVESEFGSNPNVKLNKNDCTNIKSEIKTPAGMSIKGFPTVIFNYKNAAGEYVEEEYNGNRSYPAFSKYLESLLAGNGNVDESYDDDEE